MSREQKFYGYYQSPIGLLKITVVDDQITSVVFVEQKGYQETLNHHVISECSNQLGQYFNKQLTEFTLPIAIKGTYFQELVWSKTWKVPYGQTITYKELANNIQKPTAQRAVGSALGKNPLVIIVPCHRVVSSNSSIVNYRYGKIRKQYLLELEDN